MTNKRRNKKGLAVLIALPLMISCYSETEVSTDTTENTRTAREPDRDNRDINVTVEEETRPAVNAASPIPFEEPLSEEEEEARLSASIGGQVTSETEIPENVRSEINRFDEIKASPDVNAQRTSNKSTQSSNQAAGKTNAVTDTGKFVLQPGTASTTSYTVKPNDSISKIAYEFGKSPDAIIKLNNLKSDVIYPGQKIQVSNTIKPKAVSTYTGLVVNLPEKKLYRFNKGELVDSYSVAIGLPKEKWQTPIGNFKVVNKAKDPVWNVPKSIQEEMKRKGQQVKTQVPAGPDNPLGRYWMGLSAPGIGIHSTTSPSSIGYSVSHGCMRMKPADAEKLFSVLTVDTPVKIIYQPVKIGVTDNNQVLVEVYGDVYNRKINTLALANEMIDKFNLENKVNDNKIAQVVQKKSGKPEVVS